MSRPGITYDDVVDAVQHLQKKGIYPSIDNVRNYLGTGSKTTINRHLQRWKVEYDTQYKGLSKDVIDLATLIQKQVDKIATKRINAVIFEKDFIIKTLKQRLKDK